jgi:hypothetical protein
MASVIAATSTTAAARRRVTAELVRGAVEDIYPLRSSRVATNASRTSHLVLDNKSVVVGRPCGNARVGSGGSLRQIDPPTTRARPVHQDTALTVD